MNNKIKAAFFDIDWTLFDHHQHCYIQSGIDAIKKLQKAGIKVFICTARNYASMKNFQACDLGIKWDGFVTTSGACAFLHGKLIHKQSIDKNIVRKFIALCNKLDLNAELVTPLTRFMLKGDDEFTRRYHLIYRDWTDLVRKFTNQDVVGGLLFASEEYDQTFKKEIPELQYVRFSEYGMDVVGSPHVKGNGIKEILNKLGLSKEEAIAFGDERNDVSMAEACSTFVCMGNGDEKAKAAATFITDSIENDGLLKAIIKLGLIE